MSKAYQEKLTGIIRACGETLVQDAEKIAGTLDYVQETSIWIRIPQSVNGWPTIEVQQEFTSKNIIEAVKKCYQEGDG